MSANIKDIAQIFGAENNVDNREITDLSVDSRSVVNPASTLFVALKSPNNDGHLYVNALSQNGCESFVIDKNRIDDFDRSLNLIGIDDTSEALNAIGKMCRQRSNAKFVAVTGSRGKTTVKEMIFQALHDICPTGRSPRSYNSQIGVPLSLWEISVDDKIAVIEAGISQKGEMDRLEEMIRPDIVIITDITGEHDEGFTSREEKIAEKLRLARRASTLIYNLDDREVATQAAKLSDIELIGVHAGRETSAAGNIIYVKTLLKKLGYSDADIEKMTSRCYPVGTRLQVIEGVNDCKLILDRFTPDSISLRGALDFMHRRTPDDNTRTVIIAADSFIGSDEQFTNLIKRYQIDTVITIGQRSFSPDNSGSLKFVHYDAVDDFLSNNSLTDFSSETILIAGTPGDGLEAVFTMLEAKQHETVMEVNLDSIISNFNFFRSKVKRSTGVICMLKAHGYGAGSVELARTLQAQGAAYIAVAVVDEGVELRRAGISMPIIVLNPRTQNHATMFRYHLEPEIYSFGMLEEVIANAHRYGVSNFPVHLKIETGMRRLGFLEEEIDRLGQRLAQVTEVKAATVFSHLACADDPKEDDYTRQQFAIFARCCNRLDALLPEKPRRHILNSTGIIRFPEMQYDFVRLGIGLYGIPTLFDGSEAALRNVSTLSSVIISIKHWKAGDTVSYNRRGRLERDSVIATVPIGYADGLDRHFGYGNMEMIVNGHRCKTVGTICMDICMIDVTDVPCRVGDRVEIFGESISPVVLADAIDTIPYEILVSISPRVKRVYYRE